MIRVSKNWLSGCGLRNKCLCCWSYVECWMWCAILGADAVLCCLVAMSEDISSIYRKSITRMGFVGQVGVRACSGDLCSSTTR